MEQVRWYLIRPPSVRCTWWNRMSFSSVAEYSLTAIDTRPNETAPFQIARIVASYPREQPLDQGLHHRDACVRCSCLPMVRSEERRVGKECRSRWSPYH